MPNMRNRQTFTVSHLNVVLASIAYIDMKTLEIVGEVICSPGVHQPRSRVVGVHGGSVVGTLVVVAGVIVVEAIFAVEGLMPPIVRDASSPRKYSSTPRSLIGKVSERDCTSRSAAVELEPAMTISST